MVCSKYCRSTLSTFAAIFSGIPTRRAISIARSTRFSGEILPRKQRYLPRQALRGGDRHHRHLREFAIQRNQIGNIEPAVQRGEVRYLAA